MPVFDLVTTDDNTETIANIMQRVIGDTSPNIDSDVVSVSSGGPTPTLLINGVSNGDTIPDNMLKMYQQFYKQSVSIPTKTGMSYTQSLAAGGYYPYNQSAITVSTYPKPPTTPTENAFSLITVGNGNPGSTGKSWGIYIDLISGDLWILSVANALPLITFGNGDPSAVGVVGSAYIDLNTGNLWTQSY